MNFKFKLERKRKRIMFFVFTKLFIFQNNLNLLLETKFKIYKNRKIIINQLHKLKWKIIINKKDIPQVNIIVTP